MKCLSSRVNDWTLLVAKYHSCVFNWHVFPLLPLTFWPVDLTIWWISLMIMTDYVLFRLFTVMAVISHTKSEAISGSSFWISHMHLTSDLAQPCLWVCKTPSGNSTWFQTREVIHASYNEPTQDDMQGQRGRRCVLLVISAGKWGRILWSLDPGVWGSLWVIQGTIRVQLHRMRWKENGWAEITLGCPFQWIRS